MLSRFEELGRQLVRGPNCEFCNKPLHGLCQDTVCPACDDRLLRAEQEETARQEKLWMKKYRCKMCKTPLRLGRLAYCEACYTPPLDDNFDTVRSIKREAVRLSATTKVCSKCRIEKSVADNFRVRYTRGYLNSWCKACEVLRRKRDWAKKKEAKNEQRN